MALLTKQQGKNLRSKRQAFWSAFLLCLALCVAILGGLFHFSGLGVFPFVDKFQTLIAGLLALAAAVPTLWMMRVQIAQAYELEADRHRRADSAARAVLPPALSLLSSYAKNCVTFIDQSSVRAPDAIIDPSKMPSFPPDIIETLRRSIELADPEHARTMTGLLARLQIQHSRLREAVANNRLRADEHWTDELFTDALEIYARISDLFDYARPQETMQESEPDRAAMSNALFNCGFFDEKPEVSRMIQERYEE